MAESNFIAADETSSAKKNRFTILAGLFVFLVSLALYFQTCDFELVYDDVHIIAENASITSLKKNPSGIFKLFGQEYWERSHEGKFTEAFFKPKGQALYRPLMLSAYGVIYYLFGQNPLPFHMLNILTNALVCLFVFIVVLKLFNSPRLAFFTALLFACHPIHSEAVSYITGFGELFGTMFFMLSLIFYLKASYEGKRFGFAPYLFSLLFYLAGLFTKEHVITLLGVIVLYDIVQALAGRRPFGVAARFGMYLGYSAMVGLNIAARYCAIGYLTPTIKSPMDNIIEAANSYTTQLYTALKVLSKGIWLMIMPIELSPDYSFAAINLSTNPWEGAVIVAIGFIAALVVIGLFLFKRNPILSFGIFWHFITIFVVSNITIVIGTVFGERLLYLPSLGFCLIAGLVLDRIFAIGSGMTKARHSKTFACIASIMLIALASVYAKKTHDESKKWESDDMLFHAAVDVCPNSARIRFQLGQIYANNKIYMDAEKEYIKALNIEPNFLTAAVSLAELYYSQEQYEKSLQLFQQIKPAALNMDSDDLKNMLYSRLAQLNTMLHRPQNAIQEMISLKENVNTPEINAQIGDLYMSQKNYEKAAEFYKDAWNLDPEQFHAAYKLLDAYRIGELFDKEAELLDELEEKDKISNKALLYRAVMFERKMEHEKALAVLEKAIERSKKNDPAPYLFKAKLLKSLFNYEEALVALEKAAAECSEQNLTEPLLMQIEIYKETGDLAKADATASKIKELPQTLPVKSSLGDLYIKLERYDEASMYLREAVVGGMRTVKNYVNLGYALSYLKKYEDIVAFLAPAVEELEIADPQIYSLLGTSLINISEYARGVDTLRKCLLRWGPNPWLKYQIAYGELELKNYTVAKEILDELEAVTEIKPLHPYINNLQARILLEDESSKNAKKAVLLARKGLSLIEAPAFGDPDIYLTLIHALEAAGEPDEAMKTIKEAIDKFPDNDGLKEQLDSMK